LGQYGVSGKNVLITGASSGIGKELARCFAADGANCALASLPSEKDELAHWAQTLKRRYSADVRTITVDLSREDGPEQLHREVMEIFQGLDILVNNAGIIMYGDFADLDLSEQERMVKVNAIAYMKLMGLFLPWMKAQGDGHVFNVSSAAAFQPSPHHALYGATKAFVQSLSEAVNQEVKRSGVRVFTLNPSYVDTPLIRGADFPKKLWWYMISGLGSAEDIAADGFKAFKKGKSAYIPGVRNKIIHVLLPRLLPRTWTATIAYHALKKRI
jgi:hypothetical protein